MVCLVHLDRVPHEGEEAYVLVPGTSLVTAVPLASLGALLPILAEALGDEPPCCPHCGDPSFGARVPNAP